MSSNGKPMRSDFFFQWQSVDRLLDINSFIGSDIEFIEKSVRRQRVVGTLDYCDKNSYNLTDAFINGSYFGNYVINDYEIHKWRLRRYHKMDKPLRKSLNNRSEDTTRYLIPNQLEGEEEVIYGNEEQLKQPYVDEEVEIVDVNEDEDQIVVDVESLTQRASNDVVFIRQITDDFLIIIKKIMSSNSVGFAVFGDEITRDGSIDLMAFATRDAIYVFDADNKDIVQRLKPLLESEELQKVMFALRHPSDALYHLFGIELINAVDVRVWDFCQQKKLFIKTQINIKPELRSYETIVWRYLRFKAPKMKRNIDFKQFSTKTENYIRVKTIFLRELFSLINYKLLEEVFQMNSRCIRSLRSAEGLEYIAVKGEDRELEIIDNPNIGYEETEQRIISLATNKPINGFKGRVIHIDSSEEVIIDSDEELDEIVVRLSSK